MERSFTEVEGYTGRAKKVGGFGYIEYKLLFDVDNDLYVRMTKNEGGTGKFTSNHAFSVVKNANIRESDWTETLLFGYNLKEKKDETLDISEEGNNNNSGFLKAVFRHLCRCKDMPDDVVTILSDKLEK